MAKAPKKSDERSDRETEAIRDAALKRALAMPAQVHQPKKPPAQKSPKKGKT